MPLRQLLLLAQYPLGDWTLLRDHKHLILSHCPSALGWLLQANSSAPGQCPLGEPQVEAETLTLALLTLALHSHRCSRSGASALRSLGSMS